MYGLDYLGGAKYPTAVLKAHPPQWAAGFFANTFGDSRFLVRKLFDSGTCPVIRVHLVWYDDHTRRRFGAQEINQAVTEAKRWRILSREHGRKLQISPWCEHTGKTPLLSRLHSAIMEVLPECEYVNTPSGEGEILKGVLNEIHGLHPKPHGRYNFSFDGTDVLESNLDHFKRKHSAAEIFMLWIPQFNGRASVLDKTLRSERTAWPSARLIREITGLID